MCLIGLVDPGLCGRIEVRAHRSFLNGIDRQALQTQFPPSRIELWNAPQFQLPSLHRVLIKAGARNPIATTINGHSTTNQKEILQSEFLGVGFLFMHFSQAFEDRHFTERESFLLRRLWRRATTTNAGSEDFLKAAPLRSSRLELVESMFSPSAF